LQFHYGLMLAEGLGVSAAQLRYGLLLAEGEGVPINK
jgi:TPR repeat protein